MKVSVVYQLSRGNGESLIREIEELIADCQLQSIETEEIILLTDKDVQINEIDPHGLSLKIAESVRSDMIISDYVFLYKKNAQLKKHTWEYMLQKHDEAMYDFVIASGSPKKQKKFEMMDFGTLAGPKLIRKEFLKKLESQGVHLLKSNQIPHADLLLFNPDYQGACGIVHKQVYRWIRQADKVVIDESLVQTINLIELLKGKNCLSLFEYAILNKQLEIINSAVFLNTIESKKRILFLKSTGELSSRLSAEQLEKYNLGYLETFFELLSLECYSEALEYYRMLKSKRYWYYQHKKYEEYFKKFPYDLSGSYMWKIISFFRSCKIVGKRMKDSLVKLMAIIAAVFMKLVFFGKKVYLVGEREDQAEDNGYFFFAHCREKYPKEKFYYVINKSSKDLDKVERLGNVIYHSSFKHIVFMLVADVYISAWTFQECSYPNDKQNFKKVYGNLIRNKKYVSLQHGVIIQNIAPYLSKEVYNQDLIICSSSNEKEIIKETLGYSDEEVAVTGLARFDNLHDKNVKKQILIMPTWRRSLFNKTVSEFLDSDYYNNYVGILNNNHLLELIEQHNLELKFYVHSQMQKFMEHFVVNHPRVELVAKGDIAVSELLKESALLITDYSSVALDFIYMDKPAIFYQFDPHNNHHVAVSQIKYNDLGIIVDNEEELINKIEEAVENNYLLDKQFKKASSKLFSYKDSLNCERIYRAIANL